MKVVAILASMFVGSGVVLAQCRTVVRTVSSTPIISSSFVSNSYVSPIVSKVVTPVVVKEKVVYSPVAVYQPIALLVPSYAASYVPSAAPPAVTPPVTTPAAGDSSSLILQELKKLSTRMDAMEAKIGVTPVTPVPPKKPVDPFNPEKKEEVKVDTKVDIKSILALVNTKCASCHDAKVSADKGGGLTLLDGGVLSRLTDKQSRKVITTSYKGTMPPKSSGIAALTDEEVSLVVNHYDR